MIVNLVVVVVVVVLGDDFVGRVRLALVVEGKRKLVCE